MHYINCYKTVDHILVNNNLKKNGNFIIENRKILVNIVNNFIINSEQ